MSSVTPQRSDSDGPQPHLVLIPEDDEYLRHTYTSDGGDQLISNFNANPPLPPDLTPYIYKANDQYFAGGAFGDVYRCRYTRGSASKEVAVKAFRFRATMGGDTGDKHVKMLRRELGIWKRLDHTNVVPFLGIAYGFGMTGTMSLVSLWMPNESLHTFLTKYNDNLGVVHRLQFLLDIANGLHYLHSFQIVHGDLNCNNVLLDADYTARLADFGYASLVGNIPEALSYLQRSTTRPGALRWSAPEQIKSGEMSHRTTKSDIYSFGCIGLQGGLSATKHGSILIVPQVLSGKQPWSEFREEVAVVLCLAKDEKPGRPESRTMNDSHWNFIQNCWSPMEERPAAEAIIFTVQQFLSLCPPSLPLRNLLISQSSNSNNPDCTYPFVEQSSSGHNADCMDHFIEELSNSNSADYMDPFAEGPHYGPVLEPFLTRFVGAAIKLNPLLGSPFDTQDDHLRWNMLFRTSDYYRTTKSQRSRGNGRKAPATHPRLTHIRIISRAFPWMIHARAQDPKLGVTCEEVLDAISTHLYGDVAKKEYENLPLARKRQVWDAYQFNRSKDSGAPGVRLGEGLRRLDWLGAVSWFGGLVTSDTFVKEHCGDMLPCTFELMCLPSYPMTAEGLGEQQRRLENPPRHRTNPPRDR